MNSEEMVRLYLEEVVIPKIPKASIKKKSDSKLMKLIRPVVEIFNKDFWNGFVTTIGTTIYVPDDWFVDGGSVASKLETIAHESIHLYQAKRQTSFLHGVLYLFPQVLAVFALLSILAIPFSLSWLWCLLFLLFLAPIPAPFRYKKEMEAYMVTFVFVNNVYGSGAEIFKWAENKIIEHMTGPNYYWTWPNKTKVKKEINNLMATLSEEQYREITMFLQKHLP